VPRQYETIQHAADRLCVDPKTVRRRIADGTLKAYHVGRAVRLDAEEVDARLARPIYTIGGDAA